jgi:hypothetical protein
MFIDCFPDRAFNQIGFKQDSKPSWKLLSPHYRIRNGAGHRPDATILADRFPVWIATEQIGPALCCGTGLPSPAVDFFSHTSQQGIKVVSAAAAARQCFCIVTSSAAFVAAVAPARLRSLPFLQREAD